MGRIFEELTCLACVVDLQGGQCDIVWHLEEAKWWY